VAVRIGNMKAIRRNLSQPQKNGPGNWEIYDLESDRSETTDLAEKRQDVVTAALAVLKREYQLAPGYPELSIFETNANKDPLKVPRSIFTGLDNNLDGNSAPRPKPTHKNRRLAFPNSTKTAINSSAWRNFSTSGNQIHPSDLTANTLHP
jgi:hypothetical protein